MSRRKLARHPIDGARLRNVAERKVIRDRALAQIAGKLWVAPQPLQLRGKDERPPWKLGIVERLDSEPIAGEEQLAAVAIPDREGEHAPEAAHAIDTPLLPRVYDRFGVGAGLEHVSDRGQLLEQLAEVVDLAVVYDRDRAVLVKQGLMTSADVDDREPPVRQTHPGLDEATDVVRSAVMQNVGEAIEIGRVDLTRTVKQEDAPNPAHGSSVGCTRHRVASDPCHTGGRPRLLESDPVRGQSDRRPRANSATRKGE